MKFFKFDYFSIFLALIWSCDSAFLPDLVKKLPGINFKPNFAQYSGYLQASKTHFLHYWFVLSESNPATDPLVLWLSGGPGCSSASGLLQELGPFRISDFGKTAYENVYSWNKIANVLFIESPAGVGYSYSTNGKTATNDDITAEENKVALMDFFQKFPEYKSNDFYITGESYAGIYLPTLGALLVKDYQNFPTFNGLAVGNPLLNYIYNMNYMIPFLYNHGIISVETWLWIGRSCCLGNPNNCSYYNILNGDKSSACYKTIESIIVNMGQFQHMNPYNLYFACYLPSNVSTIGELENWAEHIYFNTILKHFGITPTPTQTTEPSLSRESKTFETDVPLCAQYTNPTIYINRVDVRQALHIPSSLGTWSACNGNLNYTQQYTDMTPFVKKILSAGKKVLIYNGDVDSICNAIANQVFVHKLNRTLKADKSIWTYANDIPNTAGFVTRYDGIDFVTVRGAGHFVPYSKPREALQMLYNFINNWKYSAVTGIDVTPQPLVGGFCNQTVLSSTYFDGPVQAWQLCAQGICMNSPTGAQCSCANGYTGSLCDKCMYLML